MALELAPPLLGNMSDYHSRGDNTNIRSFDDVMSVTTHLVEFYHYFQRRQFDEKPAFTFDDLSVVLNIYANDSDMIRALQRTRFNGKFFNYLAYYSPDGELPVLDVDGKTITRMHFENGQQARESLTREHPAVVAVINGTTTPAVGDSDPQYTFDMSKKMARHINARLQENHGQRKTNHAERHKLALELVGIVYGIIMDRNTIKEAEMENFVAKFLIALWAIFPAYTGGNKQNATRFLRVQNDKDTFAIPPPTVEELKGMLASFVHKKGFQTSAVVGAASILLYTASHYLKPENIPQLTSTLTGIFEDLNGTEVTVQQISQDISETSGQSGFTSPLLMGLVAATAFSGVMSLAATTVSMYTTESRVAASDNRKSLLEMVKSNFTKGKDKGKTIYSQWKTNTNLKIQHAIISNHTVPVIQALVGELGNCVQQMPEMNPYHGRLGECLHLRGSTEKMSPSKIITNKKNLEPVCKVEYQEPEDEDIAEAFRDQLMPSGVEMGPRLSLRGRPLHALPAAVAAPRAASVPVGRPILRAAPYYYRLPGPYRYPSDAPVGLPFAAPHSAPVSRRRASSHDAPHSAPVSRRRASSHDAPFGLPVKRPRNAEKLPLMRQLDMPDDGLKRKSKQLKSGKRRKIQTKKI